jgi:hypothetical protein
MRLARKLVLLVAMALAAMALTAGAANAQEEPVEVTDEVTHCSLNTANCAVHVEGTSSLQLVLFGVNQGVISACTDEFVAQLGENGAGNITSYTNNAGPSSPCTRIKCNEVGEDWPITNTGEYTGAQADEGHLTVRFCLDAADNPGGAGTHCNAEIQVENHGNHKYGFRANNVHCVLIPGVAEVYLNGTWESEATPDPAEGQTDIEIIH